MSSVLERRENILEILSYRRFETMDNLACEFNVTRRTIQNDIVALSSFVPLYTVRGRYGGGVCLTQGYYWYRRHLTDGQKKALEDIINGQPPNYEMLQSILNTFAKK